MKRQANATRVTGAASGIGSLGSLVGTVVICAVLLPQLGWAQAAGQWRDARQMYAQTCAYCHGAGVAVELRGSGLPPEYIAAVIRTGLRAMPAFRPSDFNDADIAALVEMITTSPPPVPPKIRGEDK